MTAIAIITSLVGYTIAIKVYAWFKAIGVNVDSMNEEEIKNLLEKTLKDKRFQKYMR